MAALPSLSALAVHGRHQSKTIVHLTALTRLECLAFCGSIKPQLLEMVDFAVFARLRRLVVVEDGAYDRLPLLQALATGPSGAVLEALVLLRSKRARRLAVDVPDGEAAWWDLLPDLPALTELALAVESVDERLVDALGACHGLRAVTIASSLADDADCDPNLVACVEALPPELVALDVRPSHLSPALLGALPASLVEFRFSKRCKVDLVVDLLGRCGGLEVIGSAAIAFSRPLLQALVGFGGGGSRRFRVAVDIKGGSSPVGGGGSAVVWVDDVPMIPWNTPWSSVAYPEWSGGQ